MREAFPINHGCPNVGDFFPEKSFRSIEINNVNESRVIAEGLIRNDFYNQSLCAVREAKELVLNRYNILPILATYCEKIYSTSPPKKA